MLFDLDVGGWLCLLVVVGSWWLLLVVGSGIGWLLAVVGCWWW